MIKEIIEEKLPEYSVKQTQTELGDRELYIGASDIAGCPRKVVLSKFEQPTHDIKTLIRFQRGHIAEEIIINALSQTKYAWQTQYEVAHPEYGFIKAHLDFVLHNKDFSKIIVVENKSTELIPAEPYSSWVEQLHLQMGLIQMNYPNAAIKGSIFAVNVNSGEYTEYPEYYCNAEVFDFFVQKAIKLWDLLQKVKNDGVGEDIETQLGPLCKYCPFKKSCPEFNGNGDSQLTDDIKKMVIEYSKLNEQEKYIKDRKESIKNAVIDVTGNNFDDSFDGIKLSVRLQSQNRVDTAILKTDYPDIYSNILRQTQNLIFKVV